MPPTQQATRLFSYAAGDAASYAWCRFDKTAHGYAGQKIPAGRARKSKNEISVACNAIMSIQYVILYYIVGPTCQKGGPGAAVEPTVCN